MPQSEVERELVAQTLDDTDFERDVSVDLASEVPDADALLVSAMRASWANLAELSGDEAATDRWSTVPMREKKQRSGEPRRSRASAAGLDIVGLQTEAPMPGGLLRATIGVRTDLAEALASGSATEVLQIQTELEAWELQRTIEDGFAVQASDGSALVLELD
jgi:hypothetical protein